MFLFLHCKKNPFKLGGKCSRPFNDNSDSEEECDSVTKLLDGAQPHFLIVESGDPERPITGLSPFASHKGFQNISENFTSIKRLTSGQFLIQRKNQKASEAL